MSDVNSCYALEEVPREAARGAEIDVAFMHDWLVQIRRLDLRQAAPKLVVMLDRMSRVVMPVEARYEILRAFAHLLTKAAARLPKPSGGSRPRGEVNGNKLLLEQRLFCFMIKNLKRLLEDVDASLDISGEEADEYRSWALSELFRFLGRQIEFGLFWGHSVPPHSWTELHGIYSYAKTLDVASFGGEGRHNVHRYRFHSEGEYKRMLLLGLAGRLVSQQGSWSSFVDEKIDSWVEETSLEPPGAFVGKSNLIIVDTSKDAPAYRLRHRLMGVFPGWVLVRPSGFLTDVVSTQYDDTSSISSWSSVWSDEMVGRGR
jgi:hypothetical protein